MQVISAVAEFEKDLLIERTHSGIARARASGKRFASFFVTQWGTAAGAGTS